MEVYIVTETNAKNNLLLRSWVCLSKKMADECLKERYNIACTYNTIAGVDHPTDCLENGFFFWKLRDGQEMRYNIEKSKMYSK